MDNLREATPGSFGHAERERLKRIAALTPAQRVRIVCSMAAIARRVQNAREERRAARLAALILNWDEVYSSFRSCVSAGVPARARVWLRGQPYDGEPPLKSDAIESLRVEGGTATLSLRAVRGGLVTSSRVSVSLEVFAVAALEAALTQRLTQ